MRRVLLIGCVVVVACVVGAVIAVAAYDRGCPIAFPLEDCRVSIAEVKYYEHLESGIVRLREPNPEKYRIALVTLRINKPEGMGLTVAAADLILHYRRSGEDFDVAPCEAMSSNFTISQEEDRPLTAHSQAGPGWIKTSTGARARSASTVYMDAVFAKMENDTSDMWVCIGQPATPRYTSTGW